MNDSGPKLCKLSLDKTRLEINEDDNTTTELVHQLHLLSQSYRPGLSTDLGLQRPEFGQGYMKLDNRDTVNSAQKIELKSIHCFPIELLRFINALD